MTRLEALGVAEKVIARYPTARRDETVLDVWASDLAERFGREGVARILTLAVAFCRNRKSDRCPSLDELASGIAVGLSRTTAGEKEREPPLTAEEIARNRTRIRELTAGIGR